MGPQFGFSKSLDLISYGLIVLSILSIIIETHDISNSVRNTLDVIELVTYGAFSIEYILRIQSSIKLGGWKSYVFSVWGIIDLLAIVPFYMPMFINADTRSIRVLRLFRLTNVLKMGRRSKAVVTLIKVISSVRAELAITAFTSLVTVIFAGILMYYAEHDSQPEIFVNMSQSIWWAVSTLTTIGYGDIYPITPLGKLLASVLAFVGIGLIAIPTGLISAAYIEEVKNR